MAGARRRVVIAEQVLDDIPTGLTLYFWQTETGEGRIRIAGAGPFENRDLQFSSDGYFVGAGTAVEGACPSALRVVD
jgi:hypothetical protein